MPDCCRLLGLLAQRIATGQHPQPCLLAFPTYALICSLLFLADGAPLRCEGFAAQYRAQPSDCRAQASSIGKLSAGAALGLKR
jgi:hypothetical protein